jgi:hypothetical protein
MTNSVGFVNKEKWRIRFVLWKECETGIAIQCDALFALGEFKEFYLDLWKAVFKRYETNFPNDIKPPYSREDLAEMLVEEVGEEDFL